MVGAQLCTAFLSTLSLRRATAAFDAAWRKNNGFLSTLSLRRATQAAGLSANAYMISIHALLAESDATAIRVPVK